MKRTQSAFTLVELLVVISIIAILMGLLIPAVNAAREVARRNQCSTQIKNLALAAVQYENSKGELPGYVQDFGLFAGGTTPDPSDPSNAGVQRHKKIGTWAVALLPWLDAQPTYEHWTQDRYPIIVADPANPPDSGSTSGPSGLGFHTLASPNLAIFQCPSNPVAEGDHGKNSYVYNNGMCHILASGITGAPQSYTSAPFGRSQKAENGVGNCKYNVTAVNSNGKGTHDSEGPRVTLDDLKDGQGFTMLFSENVQALPWHRAGLISQTELICAGASDTDVQFVEETARYIHGMVWHYEDAEFGDTNLTNLWNGLGGNGNVVPVAVDDLHKINGRGATVSDDIFNKTIQNLQDARDLARPSSAHVDGVNAGFADGATRFVTQGVDYRVYQALMTPRGKSSYVPWPEFVLTDELGE